MVTTGDWVRASRYVLDGQTIRPAPGASLQPVDPWRRATVAYEALLQLPQLYLDDQAAGTAAALKWCQRYGLLGVLPHRTLQVTLAPRWRRDPDEPGSLSVSRTTYMQAPGGWVTWTRWRVATTHDVGSPPREGALVASPPADWTPSATLRPLTEPCAPATEPLSRTWARYFPGVPFDQSDTFDYPEPGTADFFDGYAEPVGAFIAAVAEFADALRGLQSRATIPTALFRLNALAGSGGLVLRQDGRDLRLGWVAGSLLGVLAIQAMQDCAAGAVRVCGRCERLFKTTAYQGAYCSPKCRQTMQKRRQRARAKGKGLS